MMRLVRAELDRLRSRRFTWIALLAAFVALAAFQLLVRSELSPPTPAEVAESRAFYQEALRDWEENHAEYEAQCREELGNEASECVIPRPDPAEYGLQPTPFAEVTRISLTVAIPLVGLAAFLVGASYVAAEFSTGAMANWLTFVPQRWRVYAAKLVSITALAVVAAAAFSAFALGVAVLLAGLYDVPTTGLSSLLGVAGRGIVVGVICAVVGFTLGFLTRHTAAAIGVLLGYLFVLFVRTVILGQQAWAARLTPWTPEANLAAVVLKSHRYAIPQERATPEGLDYSYLERTISLTDGLVYWAVLLAVLIVGSLLVFQRRDVN